MITIEDYRARVGCFCSIARKGKEKVPKSQNCFEGGSFYWPDFLLTFFMFICIMTLVLNINMALLKLLLLQIHGDVESNPGPTYKIQKTVSATFHQAHMKFGNSAGTQCSCNALFAICFSIIKKVSIWKSWDLDYILEHGDELFKSVGIPRALSMNELPNNVRGYISLLKLFFKNISSSDGQHQKSTLG